MKWKMAENSLFAVLLRSSWWVSAAIATVVIGIAYTLLPADYRIAGSFGALPFVAIAAWAAWKRLQAPSGARVARTLEAVRAMSWPEFSTALEAAWQRDGFTVTRLQGAADFALEKETRVTLVAAKRWKAVRTGIEPLRELAKALEVREAGTAAWVTAGELSEQARAFGASQGIRIVAGADLARMLPDAGRR
jgi:restriction system protein